jgi:GH24 family phage-related lysozyme (muramidase)
MQASQLLVNELIKHEQCVAKSVRVPLVRCKLKGHTLSDDRMLTSHTVPPRRHAQTSNQLSALASFSFNAGCGSLQTSTLLKKLNQARRTLVISRAGGSLTRSAARTRSQGLYSEVPAQLNRWVNGDGKVLPGYVQAFCHSFPAGPVRHLLADRSLPRLVRRRKAEGDLFMNNMWCVRAHAAGCVASLTNEIRAQLWDHGPTRSARALPDDRRLQRRAARRALWRTRRGALRTAPEEQLPQCRLTHVCVGQVSCCYSERNVPDTW